MRNRKNKHKDERKWADEQMVDDPNLGAGGIRRQRMEDYFDRAASATPRELHEHLKIFLQRAVEINDPWYVEALDEFFLLSPTLPME